MDYCINDHEPEVEKAILHLYKNKQFTDVTVKFIPKNIQFYVHKLVLALYSPVLSDSFEESDCVTLDVTDFSLIAVQNMISFCYGEPLVFRDIFEIKETKLIAEKYKIVELFNICIKEIDNVEVDMSNVLTVLEMCMEFGHKNKEMECLEIISRNRETVFTSELLMKMEFESVCRILQKLREIGSLTEEQFLRSALGWMEFNDTASKEKLMEKIEISKLSMDEIVDIIISFPNFFTTTEISNVFQKIKSMIKTEQKTTEILVEENETSESQCRFRTTESQCSVNVVRTDDPSNEQGTGISNKKSNMTITISDGKNGNKHARVLIEDNIATRGLQFEIESDLKDGKFELWSSQGNGDYSFCDVDITYDGLYFMLMYLDGKKKELSPINYIEVLKAARYLELQKIYKACIIEVNNISTYDPAFLDGLIEFPRFSNKITDLLMLNTNEITVHPNFVNCSFELVMILLSLNKLNLFSELQLLIVIISWLRAQNRLRWAHRSTLLYEIAFENISFQDLIYISQCYPDFFTDNEINCITQYKLARNKKNKKSLPKWYNFEVRELIQSNSKNCL